MSKPTCAIPECERPMEKRTWCSMHYHRWQRHGDPLGKKARPTLTERFWAKVQKTDDCWLWTGAVNEPDRYAYGVIYDGNHNPRNRPAHRVSFEMVNGPIPAGVDIDHICHNPRCVNPQHLRAATRKQNLEHRTGAQANSKSGVRGVFWDKRRNNWQAKVEHNGKQIYVGAFDSLEEADAAVTRKRNELFTHNDLDRLPSTKPA